MIADEPIERIIAVAAADLAEAARLAVGHGITAEMFTYKTWRDVFAAAITVTNNVGKVPHPTDVDPGPRDRVPPLRGGSIDGGNRARFAPAEVGPRIAAVAARAGIDPEWLARECDPCRRPVQCDRSGAVARRLIDVAARRVRAEALVAELADLGIGVAA